VRSEGAGSYFPSEPIIAEIKSLALPSGGRLGTQKPGKMAILAELSNVVLCPFYLNLCANYILSHFEVQIFV
jgi:hypothetical protein